MSRVSCAILMPALLGQVMERPHVVEPVGELHQDHPDVVHHGQQHLPEVLGLPFLAGRKRDRTELGDPFDHVRDVTAEQLPNPLDRRLGVLDDVVEEARGNRHHVQFHVREQVGDLQRMNQIGLPGMADLPLVLEGREDVRPPEQLDIGLGVVAPDLLDEVLEPDHGRRCLTSKSRDEECSRVPPALSGVDAVFLGSLY